MKIKSSPFRSLIFSKHRIANSTSPLFKAMSPTILNLSLPLSLPAISKAAINDELP